MHWYPQMSRWQSETNPDWNSDRHSISASMLANTIEIKAPAGAKAELDVSEKLRNEAELLGSLPGNLVDGMANSVKDAWDHRLRSGVELVGGLAIGSALCLLARNPRPIIAGATTWMGRGFIAAATVDVGMRFGRPMQDVWDNPEHLEKAKVDLGNNVGDAVFNYSLAIGGGIAGAKLADRFLAPTKVGAFLQGYTEKRVTLAELEALAKANAPTGGAKKPLGEIATAFDKQARIAGGGSTGSGGASDLSKLVGKEVKLRELTDGTHVATTGDGNVLVLAKDGTGLWFDSHASMLGFRRKLELSRILHKDGTHTDVNIGGGSGGGAAGKPSSFIGKDPSVYFESHPSGATTRAQASSSISTTDGTTITTGTRGLVAEVETSSGQLFQSIDGMWRYLPSGRAPTPEKVLGLKLEGPAFNLQVMTDWLLGVKKGTHAGFGAKVYEQLGEIGSNIVQHEAALRLPLEPDKAAVNPAKK